MIEIFRPAVNLETLTNRKDTEYTKKVQVGPFFGKNQGTSNAASRSRARLGRSAGPQHTRNNGLFLRLRSDAN